MTTKFLIPFFALFIIVFHSYAQDSTIVSTSIQAYKASGKIIIDGKLNEGDWQNINPVTSFVEVEPYQGTVAKHGTEVKILFDDKFIYFGVFAKDSNTRKNLRVPMLNRDFTFEDNDIFGIALDPNTSKRNAVAFQVTPYGTQRDLQSFDDAVFDTDWDALWYVKTSITDSGWYAEIAIPFNSIRYPGENSDWGINFIRIHRSSNEITAFPGYPRSLDTYRMTYVALLKGVEVPKAGMNLRINPYVLQQANSYQEKVPEAKAQNSYKTKIGGDIKWAMSQHAVLDATINTDFAQADVDRQVVNLSRFSVYFPERRQFFLENSGLLMVGDGANIEPFFSRKIGLDDNGNPIPLLGGARYTDRTANRSIGALYALQDSHDSIGKTNFSVLRYMQNYGNANNIGVMVTNKYISSADANTVASITGIQRFGEKWRYRYLWSQSFDRSNKVNTNGYGGNLNMDYASNKLFFTLNNSLISEKYIPGIGFISRSNLLTHSASFIPVFRPSWKPKFMRSFQPGVIVSSSERASDLRMQEGAITAYPVYLYFNDGGLLSLAYIYNWQLLTEDLDLVNKIIPQGDYYFHRYRISYNSDLSKKISVSGKIETGGYYNGSLTSYIAELKIAPIPYISWINSYEYHDFKKFGMEKDNFNTQLITSTMLLALNAKIQLSGFYQYNTLEEEGTINIRFSWQYKPLSYIYLVYNSREIPGSIQQQGIFKLNFLTQIR
jgi:hypothetical protein